MVSEFADGKTRVETRGEALRWLLGLLLALVLHGVVLSFWMRRHSPPVLQTAAPAVMLQFSDNTQSIRIQLDLPLGPPQVVTPESYQVQAEAAESERATLQPKVDEAPLAPDPKLVVAKNAAAESNKITDSSHAEETVREPVRQPSKQVKQIKPRKPIKPVTPQKTVRPTESERNPSEVESHASAASTSAPQPGQDSQISAAYDSHSRERGQQDNWQARVIAYLARNQVYPPQALAAHLEGRVLTTVTIDRQGNVLSVILRKSSGHGVLDQHALTAIARKSPLPAPPADIIQRRSQLNLNIPVDYDVRKYRMRSPG